jgi:type I restriction enzyme, R subunit
MATWQEVFAEWSRPPSETEEAKAERAARMVREALRSHPALKDRDFEIVAVGSYRNNTKPDVGAQTETVWLIDWKHPERNRFAIAEEVTVRAADPHAHDKRPDIVLYVNGIALGVLELKRSTVSVAEGIRQNLDNQKKEFIQHFFSTM